MLPPTIVTLTIGLLYHAKQLQTNTTTCGGDKQGIISIGLITTMKEAREFIVSFTEELDEIAKKVADAEAKRENWGERFK